MTDGPDPARPARGEAASPAAGEAPDLPEEIRRALVDLASDVLGVVPEPEVPVSLRRVRGFAPARRARVARGPLSAALEREPGFRHLVGSAWREANPELAEALDAGEVPPLADSADLLAGAYLLRPPGWEALTRRLRTALVAAEEDRHRDELDRVTARASEQARARSAALQDELDRARGDLDRAQQELAGLRREVRRSRSDADRARAEARAAAQQVAALEAASKAREGEHEQAIRRADERVREAQDEVERARRAERDGRSLADARLRLLLDTIVDAAGGLRRELALPPVSVLPGDLVSGDPYQAEAVPDVPARAYAPDDPAVLEHLLGMPRVHLIVDGYNVTKQPQGYAGQPLAEQRRRLVDGLAVLAARTGAEVTCCFDGAEVDGPATIRQRGVRVLFSDPGVTADELIRRLARAEPPGRVVVVVSSDGEVVSGVRAAGARAVPSPALLRYLTRG